MSSKRHRDRIWSKIFNEGKIPESDWLDFSYDHIPVDVFIVSINLKKSLGKKHSIIAQEYITRELLKLGFTQSSLNEVGSLYFITDRHRKHTLSEILMSQRWFNGVMINIETMKFSFDFPHAALLPVSLTAIRKANFRTRSTSKRLGLI